MDLTLIELLRAARVRFPQRAYIEDNILKVFVHMDPSIESERPRKEDKATLHWCESNGLKRVRRVDFNDVSGPVGRKIIYHYRMLATPVNDEDKAMLKDLREGILSNEAILAKYRLVDPWD